MRGELEWRDVGYVLAVACDHHVARAGSNARADAVAADLPESAWHRYSAGQGAKGPRYYDWAWTGIDGAQQQSLLIRRNIRTGELAFYRCWSPEPVPLPALVRASQEFMDVLRDLCRLMRKESNYSVAARVYIESFKDRWWIESILKGRA
jgi:hypothetical protein